MTGEKKDKKEAKPQKKSGTTEVAAPSKPTREDIGKIILDVVRKHKKTLDELADK